MLSKYFRQISRLEAAGGILLVIVLVMALITANSPLQDEYKYIVNLPIQIRIGALDLHKPLLLWVNEGLMAVFFLLLTLEIKREVLVGELSKPSQLTLPIVAAIGGIVCPALIYLLFAKHAATGWPIPTTTDIAFALAVISLLGKSVPKSLKVFLLALSIVDDILAVAIIAIFYTAKLSWMSFLFAGLGGMTLILFNYFGVRRISAYVLVGLFVWVSVVKSGVHATLAGVLLGLVIPLDKDRPAKQSPLRRLEHTLHPWVIFMVLPLFVFCNGDIPLLDISVKQLFSAVPLGISMGLLVGKSCGVFIFSWLAIKLGFADKPIGANWLQLFAISALTGIGFTMSLFLTNLAFFGTQHYQLANQGVLLGSLCSVILGVVAFKMSTTAPAASP